MPTAVAWFAEFQPFTPFIETLRALLFGTAVGSSGWQSVLWIVVIGLGGWLWARHTYERKTVR